MQSDKIETTSGVAGTKHKSSELRRIFSNFGFLTGSKVLGDFFVFLLFIVLARTYGEVGIGQYSFAIGLTGFFAVFSDFGLYHLSIKEMSRRDDPLDVYFGKIVLSRLILTFAVWVTLLLATYFLPFTAELKLVILLIGGYQIGFTLINGLMAIFIARENMFIPAVIESSIRSLIAVIGIMIALSGGALVTVLITFPAITFAFVLISFLVVATRYGRPQLSITTSQLMQLLRETIPYGLSMFLRQLSTRIDVVFLGFMLGAAAAGIYNAAYRIVFVLMMFPHFASIALFPLLSKSYVSSHDKLATLYQQSLNIIILVGLPASCGLWLIAPDLINFFYGDAFSDSTFILRLLACLLILASLQSIMGVLLTACDHQIQRMKNQWVAAWINVVGNSILIPSIGIEGAAIATLISEAILVALFAASIKRFLSWPRIGTRLAMSAVATASFCLPLAFVNSWPLLVVIPVAMLLYCGVLLLFSEIRNNEVRILVTMLKH